MPSDKDAKRSSSVLAVAKRAAADAASMPQYMKSPDLQSRLGTALARSTKKGRQGG
jgi:hypothetical protein